MREEYDASFYERYHKIKLYKDALTKFFNNKQSNEIYEIDDYNYEIDDYNYEIDNVELEKSNNITVSVDDLKKDINNTMYNVQSDNKKLNEDWELIEKQSINYDKVIVNLNNVKISIESTMKMKLKEEFISFMLLFFGQFVFISETLILDFYNYNVIRPFIKFPVFNYSFDAFAKSALSTEILNISSIDHNTCIVLYYIWLEANLSINNYLTKVIRFYRFTKNSYNFAIYGNMPQIVRVKIFDTTTGSTFDIKMDEIKSEKSLPANDSIIFDFSTKFRNEIIITTNNFNRRSGDLDQLNNYLDTITEHLNKKLNKLTPVQIKNRCITFLTDLIQFTVSLFKDKKFANENGVFLRNIIQIIHSSLSSDKEYNELFARLVDSIRK